MESSAGEHRRAEGSASESPDDPQVTSSGSSALWFSCLENAVGVLRRRVVLVAVVEKGRVRGEIGLIPPGSVRRA